MTAPDVTYANIRTVLERVFDELPDNIGPETSSHDIPEWDSIAHINVILALEREFDVKFTSAQVQQVQNIGQIVDFITLKQRSG
jgi:acyl carrier protein